METREGNTAQAAAIKLNRVPERHGGVEDPGPVAVQRNLPGPANVAHLHHPLLADGLPPGDVVRVLDAYQPRGRMVLKKISGWALNPDAFCINWLLS